MRYLCSLLNRLTLSSFRVKHHRSVMSGNGKHDLEADEKAAAESDAKRLCTNEAEKSEEPGERKRLPKKHNYAMLLCYSGTGYHGMQINRGFPTIEEDLLKAIATLGLVKPDDIFKPGTFKFQRAARTDRGVSAVRQVCSLLLPLTPSDVDEMPDRINAILPAGIRILGLKRATKNFDAKNACGARSYSYTTPSYAFAHVDEKGDDAFRLSETRRAEVNNVLSIYRGTHNFFNFTSGKPHKDRSCNRYIIECECGEPFRQDDTEFVSIRIKGQSFMLHQIRKMIGLCIAIVRGYTDISTIQKAWEAGRLDVPKAPGLGLVLEQVYYEHYDSKFSETHAQLSSWPECEKEIQKFKEERILKEILAAEVQDRAMMQWLSTLNLHRYEVKATDDTDSTTKEKIAQTPIVAAQEERNDAPSTCDLSVCHNDSANANATRVK